MPRPVVTDDCPALTTCGAVGVYGGAVSSTVFPPAADRRIPWQLAEVSWFDERAVALRDAMDAELGPRYADRRSGTEEEQRARQALGIDPATIVASVLLIDPREPDSARAAVGHAALRLLPVPAGDAGPGDEEPSDEEYEVKRVFTAAHVRGGLGAGRALMAGVEDLARRHGARRVILQTGDRQPDAVALYEKIGYTRIPIYPPYLVLPYSNCFEKPLTR